MLKETLTLCMIIGALSIFSAAETNADSEMTHPNRVANTPAVEGGNLETKLKFPEAQEHLPGYYGPNWAPYVYTCFAQSYWGQVYRAYDYNIYAAQDLAIRSCYYYSGGAACRLLGCQ